MYKQTKHTISTQQLSRADCSSRLFVSCKIRPYVTGETESLIHHADARARVCVYVVAADVRLAFGRIARNSLIGNHLAYYTKSIYYRFRRCSYEWRSLDNRNTLRARLIRWSRISSRAKFGRVRGFLREMAIKSGSALNSAMEAYKGESMRAVRAEEETASRCLRRVLANRV